MPSTQIYNSFLRGKSVNYAQKNPLGNTMGYTGKVLSGQNRLSSVSGNRNQIKNESLNLSTKPKTLSQLNNQFLTFKL